MPRFTEWIIDDGKTFYSMSGEKASQAVNYAKRLAARDRRDVKIETVKGWASKDPSGFVMDSEEDSRTTRIIRTKQSNPGQLQIVVPKGTPIKLVNAPKGTRVTRKVVKAEITSRSVTKTKRRNPRRNPIVPASGYRVQKTTNKAAKRKNTASTMARVAKRVKRSNPTRKVAKWEPTRRLVPASYKMAQDLWLTYVSSSLPKAYDADGNYATPRFDKKRLKEAIEFDMKHMRQRHKDGKATIGAVEDVRKDLTAFRRISRINSIWE